MTISKTVAINRAWTRNNSLTSNFKTYIIKDHNTIPKCRKVEQKSPPATATLYMTTLIQTAFPAIELNFKKLYTSELK